VVADTRCNGWKSSSLAASDHLIQWARRFRADTSDCNQLGDIAIQTGWERGALRTASVAQAIYLRLPEYARLWLRRKEFVAPDTGAIREALGTPVTLKYRQLFVRVISRRAIRQPARLKSA
jgi:hypothetical protein